MSSVLLAQDKKLPLSIINKGSFLLSVFIKINYDDFALFFDFS